MTERNFGKRVGLWNEMVQKIEGKLKGTDTRQLPRCANILSNTCNTEGLEYAR